MNQDLLARFRCIAEAHDGVSVKGKKMPYTSVNGSMFAFLYPEGAICLRFDETRRLALAEHFGTGPVLQYGAVMRGYVALPNDVPQSEASALFAECLTFARSLREKPTKKRRRLP